MKTAGSGSIPASIRFQYCAQHGRTSPLGVWFRAAVRSPCRSHDYSIPIREPSAASFASSGAHCSWNGISKRDILTLYLNRAPFGGTLQGVGAASWAYLGKSPAQLSYSDAALLAVLPQAPSRLRPDRWPDRAEAARNKVLERMASQGIWPARQVQESREEPVWLSPRQMPQLAPLFSRMMLGKAGAIKS